MSHIFTYRLLMFGWLRSWRRYKMSCHWPTFGPAEGREFGFHAVSVLRQFLWELWRNRRWHRFGFSLVSFTPYTVVTKTGRMLHRLRRFGIEIFVEAEFGHIFLGQILSLILLFFVLTGAFSNIDSRRFFGEVKVGVLLAELEGKLSSFEDTKGLGSGEAVTAFASPGFGVLPKYLRENKIKQRWWGCSIVKELFGHL